MHCRRPLSWTRACHLLLHRLLHANPWPSQTNRSSSFSRNLPIMLNITFDFYGNMSTRFTTFGSRATRTGTIYRCSTAHSSSRWIRTTSSWVAHCSGGYQTTSYHDFHGPLERPACARRCGGCCAGSERPNPGAKVAHMCEPKTLGAVYHVPYAGFPSSFAACCVRLCFYTSLFFPRKNRVFYYAFFQALQPAEPRLACHSRRGLLIAHRPLKPVYHHHH